MKGDLVRREPERLKVWELMKIYEQMRIARKNAPRFIFHDGPPYSNGNAHMGHLLNFTLKDAILRYKFMRGFDVPFVPGWDCHGQPIEHKYLQTSGLSMRDVEPLQLRRACAAYAMKWVRVQREQRKRMGAIGDWEHPYLTMDKSLEAVEVASVGELVREGYIYRGKKPVIWCASCETALAENAVEYGPHLTPSVYVRFRITEWPSSLVAKKPKSDKPAYVVIWTTTPWTLPGNVALAFNPRFEYDLVETPDEVLVIARELVPGVLSLAGIKESRTIATALGSDFEGIKCEHPFAKRASVGILAGYVTLESGSGVVHIAPGHGEEDFKSGVAYQLPLLSPVDAKGLFTAEFPEFEGKFVLEANSGIISLLKERGAVLHDSVLEHSYQFCWRCKNPIIFRATEQWFISLDHKQLRQKSMEAARAVAWYPGNGGERLARTIEQRPDWCISRQRSWGVPIPVFYCLSCGSVLATAESVNAVRDWVAQEGSDVWWERDAEALLPVDTCCGSCGGRKFRKEMDTLDVWFDSGVTHASVLGTRPDLSFPADLYLEAHDQFRGWFQSSLLTSVALRGCAPFKTVLVHGWVVGAQGEKMSKSLGNVLSLDDAVGRWGADVMRLWALSENYHDDMAPTEEVIARVTEAYRKLRNTLRYLLGNLGDLAEAGAVPAPLAPDAYREVDRWMLVRVGVLVREVTADLESYAFYHAAQKLHRFCAVDLSSFYLDLLKDRLYASRADDPSRRAAQHVLGEIFSVLVRMLAPFIPFTTEEAWEHAPAWLKSASTESVHLTDWPEPPAVEGEDEIRMRWDKFMRIRDVVLKRLEAARHDGTITSPLESSVVVEADGEWLSFLSSLRGDLPELLITSQASVVPLTASAADLTSDEGRLRVVVGKPEGTKCGRCWLVRPSVGRNAGHPTLCDRCNEVVGG